MTYTTDTEIQLEQALFSILDAAEQFGMDPEILRLMAVGGLTGFDAPRWVNPSNIPGSVSTLDDGVRAYLAQSEEEDFSR